MEKVFSAVVHDRQLVIDVPDEMPDGTMVEIKIDVICESVGLNESQWRTDSAALKDWKEWVSTIEVMDFVAMDDFDREFQKFNVDAVRQQMFGPGQ